MWKRRKGDSFERERERESERDEGRELAVSVSNMIRVYSCYDR